MLKNFYPISYATTSVEKIFLLPRHQVLSVDDHRHLMFVSRGINIDFTDLYYNPKVGEEVLRNSPDLGIQIIDT